ncbi:hypothetical protein FRB96_006948 [Tulasnella sp. 330]|nr:hypothetical protein FRB96_006948 [Tulasnella sp. 330]
MDTKNGPAAREYSLRSEKTVVDESGAFRQETAKPSITSASSSVLPPAYTRSAGTLSSDHRNTDIRVNFLHIREKWTPIDGAWTVDPNVHVPPGLLAEVKPKKRMHNLNLCSHHRQVRALLTLASEAPTKSHLVAKSSHGSVIVDIVAFYLTAESKHGSVTVYLPRDFEGPIAFRYGYSKTMFSDELLARLILLGQSNGKGTAFIGDLGKFGEGKRDKSGRYEHWYGDELVISTKYRQAKICYSDEPREGVPVKV